MCIRDRTITARGIVFALRELTIYPKLNGIIEECYVYEGKKVKKGDVLFKLNDEEIKLDLKTANSELLKAQVEYIIRRGEVNTSNINRQGNKITQVDSFIKKWKNEKLKADKLFKNGKISKRRYEKVLRNYNVALGLSGEKRDEIIAYQSGLTGAEVNAERALLKLKNTIVKAPFSGKIANLKIDKGYRVTTSTGCLKLVDMSKVKIKAGILESEVGYIESGRKVYIILSAYNNKIFEGKVVTVNPVIDPKTKTCQVTILADNPEEKIKPGMHAIVKIESQIFENRLLVDKNAILIRDQRKLLFIIRNGLAKWCYVETGLENEKYVEVLSSTLGLKEGEPVAVAGHYTLAHDVRVKIIK